MYKGNGEDAYNKVNIDEESVKRIGEAELNDH